MTGEAEVSYQISFSKEVADALRESRPIVALESTIISHGLPRPQNLEVARDVESIIRQEGVTPATIALLGGRVCVGLEPEELVEIAEREDIVKASIRDLAFIISKKLNAATTVAATSEIAAKAGIRFFATGGLGGVHLGASQSFDESADLTALSRIPITVVSAGVKSILDVGATLERLESYSVTVLGYQTDKFPGFYLIDSGFPIEHRVENPKEAAEVVAAMDHSPRSPALVIANPCSRPMEQKLHDELLANAERAALAAGITGKAVTPFILEYFHKNSNGESLRVNIEIIKSNSKLAAKIAAEFAQLEQK
jgi:pseudouridine-5'-phosphate glycosidase